MENIKQVINKLVKDQSIAGLIYYDALTRLENRRSYNELLSSWRNEEFTCFVLDINKMKQINDKYGHIKGDKALIALAKLLKSIFTNNSRIFRYGGDEFLVLVPRMSEKEAEIIKQKIKIYAHDIYDIIFGVAVGYANHSTKQDFTDCIKEADNMMYKDKAELFHRVF